MIIDWPNVQLVAQLPFRAIRTYNIRMKTPESEFLRAALVIALLLVSGLTLIAFHRWGTEKVPFSKAGWESSADLGDRWPMANNLVETDRLRGLTEPEVLQMLGKELAREVDKNADSPGDLSLTYVASGRMQFGLLYITFKNGRVVKARVAKTD